MAVLKINTRKDDSHLIQDLTVSVDDLLRPAADSKSWAKANAKKWLLRELRIELERLNFEDKFVDRADPKFGRALDALRELEKSEEWVHPTLQRFVEAYHETWGLTEVGTELQSTPIPSNGVAGATIAARVPISIDTEFGVSNLLTNYVPIFEETAADPVTVRQLTKAFADRLNKVIASADADHLCFVEKEVGPVGAMTMLSALVDATGLPACIFREPGQWVRRAAMRGIEPPQGARVVIVYDLSVSGSGLRHIANSLKRHAQCDTVGAVVLMRYDNSDDEIAYDGGAFRVTSVATEDLVNQVLASSDARSIGSDVSLDAPLAQAIGQSKASVEDFVMQVKASFQEVAVSHPAIIVAFESAFADRARNPMLPEARDLSFALQEILMTMFSSVVGSRRITEWRASSLYGANATLSSSDREAWLARVSASIDKLNVRHPQMFKRFADYPAHTTTLNDVIGALLLSYVANREVVPYM